MDENQTEAFKALADYYEEKKNDAIKVQTMYGVGAVVCMCLACLILVSIAI